MFSHQEINVPSIQGIELTVMNGKPITTSRQIAINFHKRHDTVLRKIETLDCSKSFNSHNFISIEYEDEKGEFRKEYKVTRDGFVYVAMGFTGKRAAQFKEAYITAFNKMEDKLKNSHQIQLQQEELTLNDMLNIGNSWEKTLVEVTHTKKGRVIDISRLDQELVVEQQEKPAVLKQPWLSMIETFFDEIENDGIPDTMRQNMLLSKEVMIFTNGKRERHDCLFFRLSNLMAFLRKTPRFADLMHKSTIQTAPILLEQLKAAGVLAFDGKEKEKGIPMNPSVPSDTKVKRVSHLVAIDLVILEREYGVVMLGHGEITRIFKGSLTL